MSEESRTPVRDELWAKHDGLTPALAAELLVLAADLEKDRDEWKAESELRSKETEVWKYNAGVVAAELEAEHDKVVDWFLAYQELSNAVYDTLEENRHLADGDNCTLKKLKDAFFARKTLPSLDSENAEL